MIERVAEAIHRLLERDVRIEDDLNQCDDKGDDRVDGKQDTDDHQDDLDELPHRGEDGAEHQQELAARGQHHDERDDRADRDHDQRDHQQDQQRARQAARELDERVPQSAEEAADRTEDARAQPAITARLRADMIDVGSRACHQLPQPRHAVVDLAIHLALTVAQLVGPGPVRLIVCLLQAIADARDHVALALGGVAGGLGGTSAHLVGATARAGGVAIGGPRDGIVGRRDRLLERPAHRLHHLLAARREGAGHAGEVVIEAGAHARHLGVGAREVLGVETGRIGPDLGHQAVDIALDAVGCGPRQLIDLLAGMRRGGVDLGLAVGTVRIDPVVRHLPLLLDLALGAARTVGHLALGVAAQLPDAARRAIVGIHDLALAACERVIEGGGRVATLSGELVGERLGVGADRTERVVAGLIGRAAGLLDQLTGVRDRVLREVGQQPAQRRLVVVDLGLDAGR